MAPFPGVWQTLGRVTAPDASAGEWLDPAGSRYYKPRVRGCGPPHTAFPTRVAAAIIDKARLDSEAAVDVDLARVSVDKAVMHKAVNEADRRERAASTYPQPWPWPS